MKLNEEFTSIDPNTFLEDYFKARGIKDVEEYLNPTYLENPEGFLNINKAYECLLKYTDKEALFIIDPDVDGFCAGAIIINFCSKYLNIRPHILLHKGKQHGLTDPEIILKIKENPTDLLIITDAGSSKEDANHCKELVDGNFVKDILILDHHQVQAGNPNAIIVNNQSKFNKNITNKALSGAGVTYKFIEYFCSQNGMDTPYYLDLVATSIVADVCDLTSPENRTFTYYGLQHLNNKFLNEAWIKYSRSDVITPDVIAWDIAPKINSLCRIDNQDLKLELIIAMSDLDDEKYSMKTGYSDLVRRLKSSKDKIDREVKKIAKKHGDVIFSKDKLIIVNDPDCPSGQAGLVAMKLSDQTNKPVLFVKKDEEEKYYSGSGRSPMPINQILNKSKLFEYNAGKIIA